jgi:hypothetical protein
MSKLWISFVVLVLLMLFIAYIFTQNHTTISSPQIRLEGKSLGTKPRIDCQQNVTYCFEDAHCRNLCTNSTGNRCRNGICINDNLLNTQLPLNECDARRGVVTFLAGNVALGNFIGLCRSVDLGIAPDDVTLPNKMCTDGTINIDYTRQFPSVRDCQCPAGTRVVILPATEQVREYAVCLSNLLADRLE